MQCSGGERCGLPGIIEILISLGLEMDLMFHFQEHFHFQSGALRLPIGKQELSLEKYKSESV